MSKVYKKVYAARHIVTGEIVTRYSANGFYSCRADAENKAEDADYWAIREGKPRAHEVVEADIVWRKSE